MKELSRRQEGQAGERNTWTHSPNGQIHSNSTETQREVKDSTIQRKSLEKHRKTCAGSDILCFCGWRIFKMNEKRQREALWLGRLP